MSDTDVNPGSEYRRYMENRHNIADARLESDKTKTTTKEPDKKLCSSCHRAHMKPFFQEITIDGFEKGQMLWKCELLQCNHKEPMIGKSPIQQIKPKHSNVTKLPMILGTYERTTQSWNPRKRRRSSLYTELDDEDLDDIARLLGYRPESVESMYSRDS